MAEKLGVVGSGRNLTTVSFRAGCSLQFYSDPANVTTNSRSRFHASQPVLRWERLYDGVRSLWS